MFVMINIASKSVNNVYVCKIDKYSVLICCKYCQTYKHPPSEGQSIATLKCDFRVHFYELEAVIAVIGSI
jgi:hypothetical protein